MLKIIMDSKKYNDFNIGKEFIDCPNSFFNREKRPEWFKDKFVRKIINDIDDSYVEMDFSVVNKRLKIGYSVDTICSGSKLLILAYEMRDTVFLATMGDNCTDFLEQIALDYEKHGQDLVIVSNYIHHFNFKYIDTIKYLNWDIECHSWQEICDTAFNYYIRDVRADRARRKQGRLEDD
jgi:hypothetical protein